MRNAIVPTLCLATFAFACFNGCNSSRPPPMVMNTSPVSAATAVPVASALTATFSETMNGATLTSNTYLLSGPAGMSVAGTVTSSGRTATFTPTSPLAPSTSYTATITTGAQDPSSRPLAANFTWTFTTGTIPSVSSTTPINGAVAVPLNQRIAANFSESMNPATITAAGTFTVTAAGVAAPGSVSYVAGSNSAIFTPSGNLAASTHYTAMITAAAKSVAGNFLADNVWSFTTGIATNTTAPRVLSTLPSVGATGVPTNITIAVTFNKPMNPSAITATGTFTLGQAGAGGADVPGTVHYAGTTATFTPTSALAASSEFTATITTAAEDLTGNILAANYVWSFTTGMGSNNTAPTVTLTSPASGAANVALNSAVNATFSELMNPTTMLTPGTFKLTVAGGGVSVDGLVTYDATNGIATYTPSASLSATTTYTAEVATAATDATGNALTAGTTPNPWTFTTGTVASGQVPPILGAAAAFGSVGGGAGITNQGINTVINGDIGTTGASTLVTGFHDAGPGCTYTETGSDAGLVNGNIETAPPSPTVACPSEGTAATFAVATQAAADAQTAYINLSPASRPGGADPGAGQLAGLVLPPGIYRAAAGSFLITGSDLTLDGQGDANAVWVFQMASTLTVGDPGTPRSVILVNGAQAKNVFWQVGTAATINAAGGGTMVGTIIAAAGVTFSTAGNAAITTLNGRALGLNASVTMVNTVVNVPAP
jgi:hypothetical protein